jgi:pimeloyl-ACP methyl ester carboxylesterase
VTAPASVRRALVLLHPLGADHTIWQPVVERLGSAREVIAVDMPGFGDAPPLDVEPTPAALAAAIARRLPVRDYDVAGNSLGGWVALELALAGHARSVTAIAPAGLWSGPLAPKRTVARSAARLATPLAGGLMRNEGVRRRALAMFAAHPERIPPGVAARMVRAYGEAPGFPAVNAAMRANHFTALADIRVPVTLAWPEYDRLIARPRVLPPNVRSVVLRGCGHMPMWDDPDQVAALIADPDRALISSSSG